jgi:hypothetical protein
MTFPENFQQAPVLECPSCGQQEFKVIESRLSGPHRRRRKRCSCGFAQTTYEVTQEYFKDAEKSLAVIQKFRGLLGWTSSEESFSLHGSSNMCEDCVHMLKAGCAFEFPEAGGIYAAECIHYENVNYD